MPVPQAAALEPFVKGLMQQHGLQGQDAPALAAAIAETLAQALALFAAQVMVVPGIAMTPAASAAPGRLM
ncbi:hypothetical protein [uncultured Thiodictyon sp.]|uniref:hypothetical protein n=1 Tax=uncultured Thiodictyon sp. TaxID=1846217 RepID=UPI0025D6F505|nr:hypothetical protein [uncultured Thiodictyon sp.]